jgi:hypothetical protein
MQSFSNMFGRFISTQYGSKKYILFLEQNPKLKNLPWLCMSNVELSAYVDFRECMVPQDNLDLQNAL